MAEDLQLNVSAGVVVVQTQGCYKCEVCDKVMTDILPHLRGKDHFNNITWEALRHPSPHPLFLDAVPPLVLEAKNRNEIELVDKTSFSFRCLVCPKQPVSDGIKSLDIHLKGNDHEKAKNMVLLSPVSPPPPQPNPIDNPQQQFPSPCQPSNVQNTFSGYDSRSPDPHQYQLPQRQPSPHLQPHPPVSSLQAQYPSTNPQSLPPQTTAPHSPAQPPVSQYNQQAQPQQPPQQTLATHTLAQPIVHQHNQQEQFRQPSLLTPVHQTFAQPGATDHDPEVQCALEEGIVVRGDGHAFTCRVCDKNVTGSAPCREHLRSDKHRKKVSSWMPRPLPDTGRLTVDRLTVRDADSHRVGAERTDQATAIPQPVSVSSAAFPDATGLDPEVQRALEEGVVVKGDLHAFTCRICDKNVTGSAPCLEHLRSDRHKKKTLMRTAQPLPDIGGLTLDGDELAGRGYDSQRVGVGRTDPQAPAIPQPVSVLSATGLDPEVQRALEEGVVVKGDGHAFTCRICDKNVTGSAPCLEHLRSDKHRKKVPSGISLPLPDTRQLPGDGLSWFRSLLTPTRPTEIGQDDASWVFPWTVVPAKTPVPASDSVYRNVSVPRGLVLIFNYYFTGLGEHERRGAKRDSFNLRTLFERMGYQVYLYEDLNKSDTESKLTDTQSNPHLKNYDSFIVFVLSHGRGEQTFATGDGSPGESMTIAHLRHKFVDSQCPALANKPKLFFVNFCRGDKIEPHMAYDGMSSVEQSPKDMVIVYSCIDNFKSPRDENKGTIFVQAWCQVLAEESYDKELSDLNRLAGKCAEDMKGSSFELRILGRFQKFYFNPVSPSWGAVHH